MSKEKRTLPILGLAAPVAMSMALMSAVATADMAEKWWTDTPQKQGWVTNYGECWQAVGGVQTTNCVDCSKLDSDNDGVNDCNDKCPDTKKGVRVNKEGCEIIADVVLSAEVLFGFDKSELTPKGRAALDDLAAKVQATPGDETLTIVGHTDPIGSDSYNQGLSVRRAQSVSSYLAGHGIRADRMKAMGKGESELVVQCPGGKSAATISCNAPNRRVEVKAQ